VETNSHYILKSATELVLNPFKSQHNVTGANNDKAYAQMAKPNIHDVGLSLLAIKQNAVLENKTVYCFFQSLTEMFFK